jgi:hypothetical protein
MEGCEADEDFCTHIINTVICGASDVNPENYQLRYCEINQFCVFKQRTHCVITDYTEGRV